MEKITKDWIEELALRYGKKTKEIRDALKIYKKKYYEVKLELINE